MTPIRCDWCLSDPLYIAYHDNEWGVPEYDDQKLFELLALECAQAGLSWITILKKRGAFRQEFSNFKIDLVAHISENRVEEMLQNPAIIRNKQKILAVISNAKRVLEIQKSQGSLSKYLWKFVENKPIINSYKLTTQIPTTSPQAQEMSKTLKLDGFKFVGPTICYAFMQSCGMVNDHLISCFRYNHLH